MLRNRNPDTGQRWKGVYCKDIISHGEGPTGWGAYLAQQMRWSFGLFEILRHYSPRVLPAMQPKQAAGLLFIQSYYPSVAIVFVLGVTLTVLHLVTGMNAVNAPLGEWTSYWLPPFLASMVLWYWMQRSYLTRADRGVGLRGMLLGASATLVYLHAMLQALAGKQLPYVITPKGQRGTREPIALFRWHVVVLVICLGALGYSLSGAGGSAGMLRFWAGLTAALMGLVIVSGLLARPEGGRVRVQAGGHYWLRVAVPSLVLLVVVGGPITADRAERVAAGSESEVSSSPSVAGVSAVGAPLIAPVQAAFLEADGAPVAFGAYDPTGQFEGMTKIDHIVVDFNAERVEEMADRITLAASRD